MVFIIVEVREYTQAQNATRSERSSSTSMTPTPTTLYPMRFLLTRCSEDFCGGTSLPKGNVRVKALTKLVQDHDKADTSEGCDFHIELEFTSL